MGMFDRVRCFYPLEGSPLVDDWQTKDMPSKLKTYLITKDGRLFLGNRIVPLTGKLEFYGAQDRDCLLWWQYRATFENGLVVRMELLESPGNPVAVVRKWGVRSGYG